MSGRYANVTRNFVTFTTFSCPSSATVWVRLFAAAATCDARIARQHSRLARQHSCLSTVSRLPSFPGKSYNPIMHKAPSFIETRAGELALWLQSLCVYKEVIANPSFIDWMEMPQEVSRAICNRPNSPLPTTISPSRLSLLSMNDRIPNATMRAPPAPNRKAPFTPAFTPPPLKNIELMSASARSRRGLRRVLLGVEATSSRCQV